MKTIKTAMLIVLIGVVIGLAVNCRTLMNLPGQGLINTACKQDIPKEIDFDAYDVPVIVYEP